MSEEQTAIDTLLGTLSAQIAPANGLAAPVSGGSDGALCLWLCMQVAPKKTRGIHYGNSLCEPEWFHQLGRIDYFHAPPHGIEAEAFRWALTANYCLREDCWPVGSRNRSEDILLTYSRPSIIATVLPIVGVWKSDVMRLCKYIGVPESILASSREPDPACGRPKELTDIGLERIDTFLKVRTGLLGSETLDGFSELEIKYLDSLLKLNEFKLALPHRGPFVSV